MERELERAKTHVTLPNTFKGSVFRLQKFLIIASVVSDVLACKVAREQRGHLAGDVLSALSPTLNKAMTSLHARKTSPLRSRQQRMFLLPGRAEGLAPSREAGLGHCVDVFIDDEPRRLKRKKS